MNNAKMNLEEVKQFYDFLKGEDDLGFIFDEKEYLPKLTDKQAFLIIYALQERFHIIPDTIEQCNYCGSLFDTEYEGYVGEDAFKCCDDASCIAEYTKHQERLLKDTIKCDFCGEEFPRIMGYSYKDLHCCGKSECYRKYCKCVEGDLM